MSKSSQSWLRVAVSVNASRCIVINTLYKVFVDARVYAHSNERMHASQSVYIYFVKLEADNFFLICRLLNVSQQIIVT